MQTTVESIIFLFSLMLIIGVLTTKFSSRLGLPSLVLFLFAGMLLNQFFYFENVELTQFIGILALIIILFEGGTQTKWDHIRPVLGGAGTLATAGVLVTSFVTGLAAMYILNLSLLEGLLFGAIVGSTDAAAVFSVLGNKNIKRKLTATLEAESGSNDPMAVFLTIAFIELIQIPDRSIWLAVGDFFLQMGLGLIFGLILGKISLTVINNIKLDVSGMYPILAVGSAIFTYGLTDVFGGSGFLAVYVMAVFIGNSDLMYRFSIVRFNEGFAWMMQIFLFILLGWLAFPEKLMAVAWQGLALSALLILVARPLGVWLSTPGREWQRNERMFIAWAGLRGAVPIVLAIYPLMAHIEKSQLIFNAVFFVVVTSALIQGSTISYLGEKLGAMAAGRKKMPHMLELVSLGKTEAEILEIEIEKGTAPDGRCIAALGLPPQVLIAAIVREQTVVTPKGGTVLQSGDIIYTLVPKKQKDYVHRLLTSSEVQPQYVPQPQ